MKKILMIFVSLFMCFTLANAEIVNLDVQVEDNVAAVYWQSDTTGTAWYGMQLYTSEFEPFVEGGWYTSVYEIPGTNWFGLSTDLLLAYGMNYEEIGNYGADSTAIAVWKHAWELSVDTVESTLVLNPGTYYVTVEGYDSLNAVLEHMQYTAFTIAETTEGLVEISQMNKNGKFIDKDGKLYILKDEKVYDILGKRLK